MVSDRDNGRVQLFSQRGQFIRTVGSKGSGEGQLTKPIGVGVTSKVPSYSPSKSTQVTTPVVDRLNELAMCLSTQLHFTCHLKGRKHFNNTMASLMEIHRHRAGRRRRFHQFQRKANSHAHSACTRWNKGRRCEMDQIY